jgi:MFS family permease
VGSFFRRFDRTSLILFLLSYANLGLLILVILEMKDFCKSYLGVQPDQLQTISAILMLPWSFKFLYAMISDSVPILGYRRKYYLIFNGFMSFFSCAMIFPDYFHSVYLVVGLLTVCQMAAASTDIIVDAIMVKEARKDPERGSEDLQTISFMTMGVAGIAGSVIGAFFT